jgi:hypothetical protein
MGKPENGLKLVAVVCQDLSPVDISQGNLSPATLLTSPYVLAGSNIYSNLL